MNTSFAIFPLIGIKILFYVSIDRDQIKDAALFIIKQSAKSLELNMTKQLMGNQLILSFSNIVS